MLEQLFFRLVMPKDRAEEVIGDLNAFVAKECAAGKWKAITYCRRVIRAFSACEEFFHETKGPYILAVACVALLLCGIKIVAYYRGEPFETDLIPIHTFWFSIIALAWVAESRNEFLPLSLIWVAIRGGFWGQFGVILAYMPWDKVGKVEPLPPPEFPASVMWFAVLLGIATSLGFKVRKSFLRPA